MLGWAHYLRLISVYDRIRKKRTMKAILLILLTVACLCEIVLTTESDVRLPPHLIEKPTKKYIVYRNGDLYHLEYVAKGTPAVRYEWKKDGFKLNTTVATIYEVISGGSMVLLRMGQTQEGYYQCLAKNQYGTALSDVTEYRRSFMYPAEREYNVVQKTVVEGMPVHIQDNYRGQCFPKPSYSWNFANKSVLLSKRIQVDDNGDLHFACAVPEDAYDGGIYTCIKINNVLHVRTTGCHTQLAVTSIQEGNRSQFAPTLAFSSELRTVGLIGDRVELRCFFYGYPVPNISWIGPTTNPFPTGRFSLINFETRLQIDNVTVLDEGEYNCTGTNAEGNSTHTIRLRVEAAPSFKNTKDGPYNVNITEGESVTFNCNPFAIPEANIVWLSNGQPLDTVRPPRRFTFSKNNKSLTIRNVCRDCVDRESKTDLMVIQCNASNVHGYAFAQGYLNVLLRTTVTIKGKAEASVDLLRSKELVFHCHVTSDPSTPPTVKWFKTKPVDDFVRDDHPYIWVENEFLVIVFTQTCSPNCTEYLGEYRCVGDNGHSRQNRTINVSYTSGLDPENFRQIGDMQMSWEMILGAGGITLVLFLFGIFLGFLSNRRSGKVKRRMKNRKVPNPPSMRRRVEYDSDSIPLEAMENNERLTDRESSVYEYIDYATFRQMLEDKGRTGGTMPRPPVVRAYSRNESKDAPQREALSRIGLRIDEDDIYDDTRCSITLEEESTIDGKTKQQNKFLNSDERLEAIANNSDMRRKEIQSYLELIPTEGHPYSDLCSKEMDPCLDSGQNETIPCINMEKKEMNPCLERDGKEMNSCSTEDALYLDMDKKK